LAAKLLLWSKSCWWWHSEYVVICTFTRCCYDIQSKKDELGRTCSMYGVLKKHIQNFGRKTWMEKSTSETWA
jgi:hypothetical protein